MTAGKAHDLRSGDAVVVRTPLLPLSTLVDWASSGDLTGARAHLAALLALPEVDEALYVASPGLHGAIAAWRAAPETVANQRVELSLARYIARMAGRATPFGLFAGVSAGKLGRETQMVLSPRAEYRRRTRLDNDYLFVLADALSKRPDVRARLVFRPNNSLYTIAGRMRYAAARLAGSERRYHLVAVEPTPYLEATLVRAVDGSRLGDLAAALVDDEITRPEADAYIEELVDAQVLLPDLGVFVTGPEPIDGFLAQLEAAGVVDVHTLLSEARAAIATIDAHGLGNRAADYEAIAASLASLPAKVDPARLFQVDMVKPATVTLDTRVAAELAQTVAALARIAKVSEAGGLDELKRAFSERWEDREVPLAEVLDEESGIGFEAGHGPGSEGSPLLADLGFPGSGGEPRVEWGPGPRHKLKLLSQALARGAEEIVLADADLDAMELPAAAQLPDAFAAIVRLAGTPDEIARREPTLYIEGVSGPSGARILGRFCHASPDIDAAVRAHHAIEEAARPDAIFAEIVHLNEGRIGNILCRPVLRAHEVVYLGISGAPREQQIHLDDLMVSVRGDRIVLRSRRLGREVIPRMSTAHNYRLRSLGAYRFLCALATQGAEVTAWGWGPLGSAPFLPRVRIGRAVVSRATWNLDGADLEPITKAVRAAAKSGGLTPANRAAILAAVAGLRAARRLPRYVVIASGDNELPIDLENALLAQVFADELSGSSSAVLLELFPAPDHAVVVGPEGRFAAELVLTFTRTRKVPATPTLVAPRAAQRSFSPGSGWLYAKIYCGESTADRVLRDAIAPVVREAQARGDISQWFFIRYRDPEPHLRVRFCGEPGGLLAHVLPALDRALAPLVAIGAARKLVLDTYDREIERYGGDRGIELVERIFWRDSEAVLGIVELLDGDAGADARWRLTLRGIESLFTALGLEPHARAQISADAKERLGREHRATTPFWTRIGDRFTRERASLELLFAPDAARDAAHELAPGFELLAARDLALADTVAELRARDAARELVPGLEGFAWSVAHMHANRLIHASHRAHELVLYDFLRRLHAAQRARARS